MRKALFARLIGEGGKYIFLTSFNNKNQGVLYTQYIPDTVIGNIQFVIGFADIDEESIDPAYLKWRIADNNDLVYFPVKSPITAFPIGELYK